MSFFIFLTVVIGLGILCGTIDSVLKHKREMAKILHKGSGKSDTRLEALEMKVAALTEIVHDQTLIIENLNSHPMVSNAAENRLRV